MNSVVVLIIGLGVAFFGYRVYAKYIDQKIVQADPKRATPAKMYMDGVDFMPTSKSILFGYQFKSIAGAAPIIGPILAVQWGWLPALLWILGGALFIGWAHDYSSAMIAMRHEGASFGGLSYKLISPRARMILLAFIYFYLLLVAGAFGNIVVGTAVGLKGAPVAWVFMTIAGVLAGQMIYRWRKDIILTTVVCVGIILIGIYVGTIAPSDTNHRLRPGQQPRLVDVPDVLLLLLWRRPAHLAVRSADQLRCLLHRFPGARLRAHRGYHQTSGFDFADVYELLDSHRAHVADALRHHCLRGDFGVA